MDGAEWDGYGVELSRTGGLRGDLVNFEHTHTHTHTYTRAVSGFATRIETDYIAGNLSAVFNNI